MIKTLHLPEYYEYRFLLEEEPKMDRNLKFTFYLMIVTLISFCCGGQLERQQCAERNEHLEEFNGG